MSSSPMTSVASRMARPVRIISVGTANPPTRYTQAELIDLLGMGDRRTGALFRSSHIKHRHLVLPMPEPDGRLLEETNVQLLHKHKRTALDVGRRAICDALAGAAISTADVDYLVCATSTGFLCPGLSAWFVRELGMRADVGRVDVVGMGCNAGINSLQTVAQFCAANPGRIGLLVCAEICSAAYVFDDTVQTAVVNSLFGDGVGVVVLRAGVTGDEAAGPAILGFKSAIVVDAIDTMRLELVGSKFSFFLEADVPYTIGHHVEAPVDQLVESFGLRRRDVRHWIVHSGGRKVIDAIKYNLGLTDHDVRHTKSVLRDFGNLSSGSFLFSYRRLLEEGVAQPGEIGVMITMGPGASIETCLVRY